MTEDEAVQAFRSVGAFDEYNAQFAVRRLERAGYKLVKMPAPTAEKTVVDAVKSLYAEGYRYIEEFDAKAAARVVQALDRAGFVIQAKEPEP